MTSTGRVARLTALALATGTLVAAGAGSAGAASKTNTSYTANGTGSVVSLKLNLPVELPGIGSSLTQSLVSTASNARTSMPGVPAAAVTTAVLGSEGNIPVVSAVLDKAVSSTWGGKTDPEQGAFPENPLLAGGVLKLKSVTANPDVQGAIANCLSSVANLTAVLNALVSQLTANLQGVIGTLPNGSAASPVAGVTNTVTTVVNQLISQLPVVAGSGLDQAAEDALDQVTTLLNTLPEALSQVLTTKLKAMTADTSLLKIGLIESGQTVTNTGSAVTSTSKNQLLNISLLGGLAKIGSLTSEAVATLGDSVSDADAKGHADLLNLDAVDGLLTLDVTNQLDAILGSNVLPAEVIDAVNTALAAVTDALKAALGIVIKPATFDHSATADKASAEANALRLVVQPVGFAKPIIDLALAPAKAEVVKAQAATPPTQVITPGKAGSTPQFAPTGANFGLTAPIAVGLMGLAVVARRRRMAHLEG
jgi:hypothetical protein